jgi:hypothetical protein
MNSYPLESCSSVQLSVVMGPTVLVCDWFHFLKTFRLIVVIVHRYHLVIIEVQRKRPTTSHTSTRGRRPVSPTDQG